MAHKTDKFKLAGVSFYTDDIMENLATDNDDYSLTKKELLDEYSEGDKIFKYEFETTPLEIIPEPENEHDPDAIKVVVNGTKVGYIKKGATKQVRSLLESPDFSGKSIEIYGGEYKTIYDGNIEKGDIEIGAEIEIYTRIDAPVRQEPSENIKEEPQKPVKDNSTLIKIEMLGGIVLFVCGLIGKSFVLSAFGIVMSVLAFVGNKKRK